MRTCIHADDPGHAGVELHDIAGALGGVLHQVGEARRVHARLAAKPYQNQAQPSALPYLHLRHVAHDVAVDGVLPVRLLPPVQAQTLSAMPGSALGILCLACPCRELHRTCSTHSSGAEKHICKRPSANDCIA